MDLIINLVNLRQKDINMAKLKKCPIGKKRVKGKCVKNRENSWTKLKSSKSQPNTEMWGNEKRGGMVFVSKSKYPVDSNIWRMGGVNGRGYIKEKYSKTKPEAMRHAETYMKKH